MTDRGEAVRNGRRARILLALVLLGAMGIDMTRFVQAMQSPDRMPTLQRWLPFAVELGSDDRLYDRHPDYKYPPLFLILLRPLTWIPPVAAAVVWQLAKYASLFVIFVVGWRLLEESRPLPPAVKPLSVILSLRFIVSDLGHGNINIFICLLVVLALWALARGRPWRSGLLVALAACIKVTPALWGVYFLYQRRWRAAAGFGVGLLLGLEAIPAVALSPDVNHRLMGRWYGVVVRDFAARGHIESVGMNQSLTAVTNRLLGRGDLAPGERSVAIVDLDDGVVVWIQRAMMLAMLAVLGWTCRGPYPLEAGATARMALVAEWSLVGCATLVLSGFTWTGHFCLLITGQIAVLAYLFRPTHGRVDRTILTVTLIAQALLVLTSDLIGPAGREWCKSVGLLLLGVLLLATAVVLVARRCRRPDDHEPDRSDEPLPAGP